MAPTIYEVAGVTIPRVVNGQAQMAVLRVAEDTQDLPIGAGGWRACECDGEIRSMNVRSTWSQSRRP